MFHLRDMDVALRYKIHKARHRGFREYGKGKNSSWKNDPDVAAANHMGRIQRSSFSDQFFLEVDHGLWMKESRKRFYRTVPANGKIRKQKNVRFTGFRLRSQMYSDLRKSLFWKPR